MSCENCEEGDYVIDKLAKLLAEIAVRQLRSQTEENQGEHTHE